MELEQQSVTFEVDEQMQGKVDALVAQGWGMAPGVKPMATYHLVRVKPPEQQPGLALGIMQIDDSKVFVIPAAKS